jgi:hypothetical protein
MRSAAGKGREEAGHGKERNRQENWKMTGQEPKERRSRIK